jgi:hypothetical protein
MLLWTVGKLEEKLTWGTSKVKKVKEMFKKEKQMCKKKKKSLKAEKQWKKCIETSQNV